jgi:hypothetical protein
VPPIGNLEWDWEIGHPLCNGNENQTAAQTAAIIAATVANPSSNPSCAADLGITSGTSPVIAVDGETAPVTNPSVLDIDGFDNTGTDNADESISLSSSGSPVVAELHALGDHVICYVDVGTAENWRPDYSEFPAALLGNNNGWPGERWLDTNPNGPDYATLEKIMTARFEMCKNNGFDAVEPDNLDGSENTSGFNITIAEGDEYAEWLANEIHSLGMSVAQKNFEDQSAVLEPYFDFVIEEQCFQYGDCTDLAPYYESSKAALGGVLTEQRTLPDVPAKHRRAPVAGLIGDDALGDAQPQQPRSQDRPAASDRPPRRGRVPATGGVALQHEGHRLRAETCCADAAMTVHGAESGSLGDA